MNQSLFLWALCLALANTSCKIGVNAALFNKKNDKNRESAKKNWQELDHASTGTVTQEEETVPVTCDEIMAQAVVNANAEKMVHIQEKERSQEEAASLREALLRLQGTLNKTQTELSELQEESSTIEAAHAEALKLQETEAEKKLSDMAVSHEEALQAVKDTAEKEILQFKDQILQMQNEAAELAAVVEGEKVAALEKTKRQVEEIKKEAAEQVATLKEEKKAAMEEAKRQVEEIKQDMEDMKQSLLEETERNVTQIAEEAKKTVEMKEKEKQEDLQRAAREMMLLRQESETNLSKKEQEAAQKIKEKEEEAAAQKEAVEKKLEEEKKLLKREIEIHAVEHENTKKVLTAKEQAHKKEREEVERQARKLEENLKIVKKDLSFWEDFKQPYCNFTMIQRDTVGAFAAGRKTLKRYIGTGLQDVKDASAPIWTKLVVVVSPAVEWFGDQYEQNLAEHVTPIYKETVAPAWKSVQELLSRSVRQIAQGIAHTHRKSVEALEGAMAAILTWIEENDKGQNTPDVILAVITDTRDNAEDVLDTLLELTLIYLMIRFRSQLFRGFLFLLTLPFRILLYPFGVPFGKKKGEDEERGSAEPAAESAEPAAESAEPAAEPEFVPEEPMKTNGNRVLESQ